MDNLNQYLEDAMWVAKSLFDRGKTAGSSANISFRFEDKVYISATNTCFGRLDRDSFAEISLEGKVLSSLKPSKEYPMHLAFYQKDPAIHCVVHTHSFYATLWASLPHQDKKSVVPSYTPYLQMKLGDISLVDYYQPGSKELFAAFKEVLNKNNGYLLANHGPVVGGNTILAAFYALEELEESCKIAWHLRDNNVKQIGGEK